MISPGVIPLLCGQRGRWCHRGPSLWGPEGLLTPPHTPLTGHTWHILSPYQLTVFQRALTSLSLGFFICKLGRYCWPGRGGHFYAELYTFSPFSYPYRFPPSVCLGDLGKLNMAPGMLAIAKGEVQ